MEEKKAGEVKIVRDGGLAYYEYEKWQGKDIQLKIRCQCGGETEILAMQCHPTDPRFIPLLVGFCEKCSEEMTAAVFFYQYKTIENGEKARFSYLPWRRKMLPVQIQCPDCKGKSFPLFVNCLTTGAEEVLSMCQDCQAVLSAWVEFVR